MFLHEGQNLYHSSKHCPFLNTLNHRLTNIFLFSPEVLLPKQPWTIFKNFSLLILCFLVLISHSTICLKSFCYLFWFGFIKDTLMVLINCVYACVCMRIYIYIYIYILFLFLWKTLIHREFLSKNTHTYITFKRLMKNVLPLFNLILLIFRYFLIRKITHDWPFILILHVCIGIFTRTMLYFSLINFSQ